jgi:acetoin utilization protein AcuC
MGKRELVFLYSDEIEKFPYPEDCPFKSERAPRLRQKLVALNLLDNERAMVVEPKPASRQQLEWFHFPNYLDELSRTSRGELSLDSLYMGLGGDDTPIFRGMYDYGAWAAGASIHAAELVLSGDARVAFNPTGGLHHAQDARASGFCYINDVVLGCMRLTQAGKRVFCLDLDAHHGDGTQAAFYRRKDVMFLSLHESGTTLFPGTGFETDIGEGEGRGYTVNVPLPAGTYDQAYLTAFQVVVPPLIQAYQPDIIVVQFGMDTLAGDPLTHFCLTNNVYPQIIDTLLGFGRPMLFTGGGGYHVENTVRGWARIWQRVCGEEDGFDLSVGTGGVLLSSSEWVGGLQDRAIHISSEQKYGVERALYPTLQTIVQTVFPLHGLDQKVLPKA